MISAGIIVALSSLLALLAFCHRYGWYKSAVSYRAPRILMYHMISEHKNGAKFNKLRVKPQNFEQQIAHLKQQGWNFVFMSELNDSHPEKTVAITFDDGFADNFINAQAILEKYQAKATLYLVVDRHNRDWSSAKKAHHNSGELMREAKLSDQQVRHMLDSGLWQLGGHTLTHANLSKLKAEQKQVEISQCKQALEQQFNTQVSSFAYPFGIYDQTDVQLSAESGYLNAVTTEAGISNLDADPQQLKRIKVSGKDNMLAFKIRLKTGLRGWQK